MKYRCTRPMFYGPRSAGFKDPSARQGYYIEASSVEDAERQMRAAWPQDTHFDITPEIPALETEATQARIFSVRASVVALVSAEDAEAALSRLRTELSRRGFVPFDDDRVDGYETTSLSDDQDVVPDFTDK